MAELADAPLPTRFVVVQEDDDGAERPWTRCAEAEGLFVLPEPVVRETLTLAGAQLDPRFHHEEATRWGDVGVEVWTEARPIQWWTLLDVVVLERVPKVVIEAGVELPDEGSEEVPGIREFQLFGRDGSMGT